MIWERHMENEMESTPWTYQRGIQRETRQLVVAHTHTHTHTPKQNDARPVEAKRTGKRRS